MASSVQLSHSSTKRRTIDLLIAEETSMNCQLLKSVFRWRSSFRVVACTVSSQETIAAMNSHNVDLALINENLQDGPLTGFSVLSELRASFPKTRVIVLLKSSREELIVDAFRAGARGVFCQSEPLYLISKCVHAVHDGQVWANSRQLGAVLDAFAATSPLRSANPQGVLLLTKRERDVVQLVVQGYTNREVASKLDLSEHTVGNYLFRIYEKLGISSRVELVLYSIKAQHTQLTQAT